MGSRLKLLFFIAPLENRELVLLVLGGEEETHHDLIEGEYIEAVEQTNAHVGYLGASLTFTLSSGREIRLQGTHGHKRIS